MMRNQTPQANQWVFLLLASAAIMNANCDSSSTGVSPADLQALARSLEKNPELATRADGGGATLLHHTAAKGDAQAAMLLLDTGAPMSSKDGWGYTPLHWAADAGAVETAKLLLSRGIAPDAGAMNGQTPLHRAAWGGSADMVKLLLSAGADVSAGR